jgi:hypothetical protein
MRANHFHPECRHSPLRLVRRPRGEFEHALETTRRVQHEKAGRSRFDAKGVRDAAREGHECARLTEMSFPSDVEAHRSVQNVPTGLPGRGS